MQVYKNFNIIESTLFTFSCDNYGGKDTPRNLIGCRHGVFF